jgi:hypothetical protein
MSNTPPAKNCHLLSARSSSLLLYRSTGARWGAFFLLFLWPDLSMLGYLISVRCGSRLYNVVHTYIFPLALAGLCVNQHKTVFLSFAFSWLAHLGLDRSLGYGLKYPTFFKDTHLQRLEQTRPTIASNFLNNP